MHRGQAAFVLGPPPSRSRDLELEGGVIACHVDYVYEPQDSPCEVPSNGVVEKAYCLSVLVKLRFRLRPVTQKPLIHGTAR